MYEYEKNKLKFILGDFYEDLKNYNVILSGGAITSIFTNREINDFDLYFRSQEDMLGFICESCKNNWILAKTDKAILFKHKELQIQCIYFKYFETANDIFNTFDFTINMGAYDFKEEQFILHEYFLIDNSKKILRFNENTAYPIISALRVNKYKDKGYYISRLEFIKIMLTICSLNIDNYDELTEQIGGMYGESYDEVVDISNVEFNMETVIKSIDEFQVKNHINERDILKTTKKLNDKKWNQKWEEYIYELLGVKYDKPKKEITYDFDDDEEDWFN